MMEDYSKTDLPVFSEWNMTGNFTEVGNVTLTNNSEVFTLPPLDLGMFYRPDWVIITLYVTVLATSLSANSLLIFIVIKFQYMRR